MKKRGKKKYGFTLAEVLITLGIIGLVAEMTIPALIHDFQDAVLKTSFKKAYSVASQAWAQAVAENPGSFTGKGGWSCTWADGTTGDYNANDGRIDAFKSKMKVVKSCVAQAGCWPDNYETYGVMLGEGANTPYSYSWISADGMCWAAPWKNLDESSILVDTNCNKNPNKIGKDIFHFQLGVDGIIYFVIGDPSPTGKQVSSGLVCPHSTDPLTISGRNVSFKSWLYN